jgi:colanic acid/amylovoran biosynthesis glycosyltransferase
MPSIAFINNYFPAVSGTFIYREVLGLRKRGLRIRTFSMRKPPRDTLSQESLDLWDSTIYLLPIRIFAFIHAHFFYLFRKPNCYLKTFLFLMTRRYNSVLKDRMRTFFHFCEAVYFAKMIEEDSDIVHIHAHYASHPCTVAFVASRFTETPFSFTAHASDIWADQLFLAEKANAAAFVITCTNYGKRALLDTGNIKTPEKICTIYHGIDVNFFSPLKSDHCEPITILNVGRVTWEKAQIDLLKACSQLKREGYPFRCIIAGDGPLLRTLRDFIADHDLVEEVVLLGRVFQESIREIYSHADIFVLSSVQENLPNVLLESMAMGLPVVATNIAGVPELIIDRVTGLLVRPNNPNQLAESIKILIDNRDLAFTLAKNGREYVCAHFDIQSSLNQLQSLYESNL